MLQGLLDTDGSVAKNNPGIARFHTISELLVEGVIFIAQSLGATCIKRIRPAEHRKFPGAENTIAFRDGRLRYDCGKG